MRRPYPSWLRNLFAATCVVGFFAVFLGAQMLIGPVT